MAPRNPRHVPSAKAATFIVPKKIGDMLAAAEGGKAVRVLAEGEGEEEVEMRDESRHGMGPGGFCVCPKCGERAPHEPGIPCREHTCPGCGSKMVREGSYHHELIKKGKRTKKDS
ncbi:MAG: hypothetical protein V1784_00250 [bacterium]